MTAYLKAKELIIVFQILTINFELARKSALFTVQEILNSNPHSNPLNTEVYSTFDYWIEVKKELNKL